MALVVALGGLAAFPASAGMAPGRDRLPVVIKGRDLVDWVNVKNLTQIYLYRYDPNADPPWIPIPFQIDKRRKINFIHNVGTPQFLNDNHLDTDAYVCALSYFPPRYCSSWTGAPYDGTTQECPLNYGASFQSDLLGSTDEVVFMARDLGTARDTSPFEWLSDDPGLGSERIEILVPDDGDNDGQIEPGEEFWVYAYLWYQPPPVNLRSNAAPPTWSADASCSPCAGAGSGNNVFNEDCGTFRGISTAPGREGYEVHSQSNWQYDVFKVIPGGGSTPNADILHSWNMSAGVETNQTWDCAGLPRPMDVRVPGTGQVRVIRGIQGSASGIATMKYDKAYDTAFETEIELRVHELQNLFLNQGQNTAVKNSGHGAVWAESVYTGSAETPQLVLWDRIDGQSPTVTPTPKPDDWWQMIDGVRGGTASYLIQDPARGPIPADSDAYNYVDQNSEPFGNFGRMWYRASCMQDGNVPGLVALNEGGCPSGDDPEAPELLFKRLYRVTIPTPASDQEADTSVRADDWDYAVRHPLISGTSARQCDGGTCGGGSPPPPFCTPTLSAGLQTDGSVNLSADIAPGSGCDDAAGMFGLTEQVDSGPETIVGYLLPGAPYRFRDVTLGVPLTFRAFALAADGRVSSKSQPVTVTPADTTPPPPPIVDGAQGTAGGISIDFEPCRDASGLLVNVYLSETSGGPYVQANPTPLYVSGPHQVTIAGLQDGTTYYGVLTLVDLSGNESAYSPEFVVTAGP